MQASFPLRLLEVNSTLIWHWPYLQSVIRVMIRDHFNGLVINQQNLFSLLVSPSKYCQHGRENLFCEHQEHLLYLQRLCRYCHTSGIRVWLQGEALPRDAKIQEKYPEYALIDNSNADELFWKSFYQHDLYEALGKLPGIDGIIVNLHRHQPYKASWALMNPLMILVKIIKLRWIHILSYDQMVSRKINNQTTRCANSIFYTTLFTNSAPNYT
ncbi:TPA: hypothetical protein ACNAM8_004593 [Escherichia coli]